jgi:eukaryotic-like serine/threonine-protein kinase
MVEPIAERDRRRVPGPGAVISGRYLVERTLGKGGMGAVVAARDLVADRTVAMKFLLPVCADDDGLVVRFEREARATERLRSEHVRRVLGSGVDEVGRRYLVMEYLEGEDLRALVKREGPLDPERAAAYVAEACHGLAEAHALGVVHRDLKPANLFLARRLDGSCVVKIVDFGVAKFESPNVAGDSCDMTASQMVLGSRHFMAPEQILDPKSVDALADVWALGAILYYLLSGRTPFDAPSIADMTLSLLSEAPQPLLSHAPDVPQELVDIVSRCLERDRNKRYPNVVELLRALDSVVAESGPGSRPRGKLLVRTMDLGVVNLPPAQVLVQVHAAPAPTVEKSRPASKPSRAAPLLASFAVGIGIGLGVLALRPPPRGDAVADVAAESRISVSPPRQEPAPKPAPAIPTTSPVEPPPTPSAEPPRVARPRVIARKAVVPSGADLAPSAEPSASVEPVAAPPAPRPAPTAKHRLFDVQ